MTLINPQVYEVVNGCQRSILWKDLWIDVYSPTQRRNVFWDAFLGVNRVGEWRNA